MDFNTFSASLTTAEFEERPTRHTAGEKVDVAIRAYISSGEVLPGQAISIRKLAEALSVSMTPVRHAMSRLQSDGVVEILPGRSVRIPILSVQQFAELSAIRMEIEGFAAERAALACSTKDIDALSRINTLFQCSGVGTSAGYSHAARVNREFHFTLYQAAGMPSLIEMIERLWLRVGPSMFAYLPQNGHPASSMRNGVRFHKEALIALGRRDAAMARKAIRADIETSSRHLIESGFLK